MKADTFFARRVYEENSIINFNARYVNWLERM